MKSSILSALRRPAPVGGVAGGGSAAQHANAPRLSRPVVITLAGFIVLSAGIIAPRDGAFGGVPAPAGSVFTADEYGNSISRIDLATGKVETVPISVSPHNVDVSPDRKLLLAVGTPAMEMDGGEGGAENGMDEEGGLLLVFNSSTFGSDTATEIAVGEHPAHVVATADGRFAFVTQSGENSVAVVDLSSGKVVKAIETGRFPHGLRISPDAKEIYVADVEEGSVSVIDIAEMDEVARIPVGTAPVQVGFTPDGAKVFVSLRDENKVAVIDTKSRQVVAKIEVGRNPIQVFATPDGSRVYVANQGSSTDPDDTVSVIDVASLSVVDTILTGKGAHGVSISPDGSRVFVSNIVDGTVSIIDDATLSVVATVPVGSGPNGIAFRAAD